MKVKLFQKNAYSENEFNEGLEKELNDWLRITPDSEILDIQFSLSVCRWSSKEVYTTSFCMIFYKQSTDILQRDEYQAKLLYKCLNNSRPIVSVGELLEHDINAWLMESSMHKIEIVRSAGGAIAWADDSGYSHNFCHSACLILYRVSAVDIASQ